MIRKTINVEREHAQGGEGTILMQQICTEEELLGKARLFSHTVLPPGTSVGWHRHEGDTEPYYILKGKGIFIDDDGSRTEVGPGDCCLIEPGQCHSIINESDENLEFIALIYYA